MSSPPVPVVSAPEPPQPVTLVCANCHAALDGEYCSACGQRHEPHVHTVAHFASEAFESVSHADSRLWRTLWYLLARPGFLTREFFAGRRVRYLPPFRLYLVISVVFFLVVGLPDGPMIIDDGPTPDRVGKMNAAAEELETASGPGSEPLKKAAAAIRLEAGKEKAAQDSGESNAKPRDGLSSQNAMTEFCEEFKVPDRSANENYAKLHSACAKITEDGGRELGKTVVHNIPRAMFVFLPLLALFMRLLYWKPKRYYVEHLLFLLHNHANVFLSLTILLLVLRIPHVADVMGVWLNWATFLYMVWYIYRAMRNFYGQGRALTIAKYFLIGFAYLTTSFVVILLTALYSAMTV